jgi:hypothetical protein
METCHAESSLFWQGSTDKINEEIQEVSIFEKQLLLAARAFVVRLGFASC